VPDAPPGGSPTFLQLFEAHREALCRYAHRIVHSREMAEDVVQDVFLRLWRVWDDVEIGSGTRSYLYLTTRSRALNCLKHEQREDRGRHLRFPCGIVDDEPALAPEGEANVDADEIVQAIERVLAAMPPRQREVAALRLRHQLTTMEIAHRLGISPRTVEVHIGRATKALRKGLPTLLGDDARVRRRGS
jgi:RNA polymerase sigma-70 factor (ECF subfamily)